MTFWSRILSTSTFSNSLVLGTARYGVNWTDWKYLLRSLRRSLTTLTWQRLLSNIVWNPDSMSLNLPRYWHCLSDNLTYSCRSCTFREEAWLRVVWRKIWKARDSAVLQWTADRFVGWEACVFSLPIKMLNLIWWHAWEVLIGRASRSSASIACMMLGGCAAWAIFICFGSRDLRSEKLLTCTENGWFGLEPIIHRAATVLGWLVDKASSSTTLSLHALVLAIMWCCVHTIKTIPMATRLIDVFFDFFVVFSRLSWVSVDPSTF